MLERELTAQEEAARDDELIAKTLSADPQSDQTQLVNDVLSRPLETGEKAEDAVDFEDIGDDDLADDEDLDVPSALTRHIDVLDDAAEGILLNGAERNGLGDDSLQHFDVDDLFGETSNAQAEASLRATKTAGNDASFTFDDDEEIGRPIGSVYDASSPLENIDNAGSSPQLHFERTPGGTARDDAQFSQWQDQQRLFHLSKDKLPPAPPENQEELLHSLWPKFRSGVVPRFLELLPPKRARYVGKTPPKIPKPVQLTKVHLELAPDHEKSFKVSAAGTKRTYSDATEQNLVIAIDPTLDSMASDDEVGHDINSEDNLVGGISWQDFQVVCADWDIPDLTMSPPSSPSETVARLSPHLKEHGDASHIDGRPSSKRQKTGDTASDILAAPRFEFPDFPDAEAATATIAKRVVLDLNDPNLLLVEQTADHHGGSLASKESQVRSNAPGPNARDYSRRYNISNDDAYDKLKQNHQNRVRSTLSNMTVTHAMPALRLQWPYYKTKLAKSEARSFHRPMAHFHKGEPITFQVPKHIKKKHLRGKDPQAIFNKTQDLSLSDNSHVMLLEYSEEYPTMLSNFGMASRLINYYRKKNQEDSERPKSETGELAVLLPNDTSPLTQFGEIKPGATVPTICNGLYKAPIFQQDAKPTDFLMIRNGTGTSGGSWYLRNIEYLRVVGQQFPVIEVPPPGGRRVTTAAKNRLKMISYRLIRRRKPHRISVSEITAHVADSTDMQNRQKMKDFMVFSKEHKEWEMRPGEQLPDEETIRSMVSPEDVCLLESMQVGQQHLEDSGLGDQIDVNEDADELKEGQTIEQQLAPWQTTKNFLSAIANKAMLQLHGEGDPTSRGQAFSFLRTSMKGGFRAIGESVEDRLDAKRLKELGGHSYNVQKQAESYRESIRRIWEAQHQSLSSTIDQSDEDMDSDGAEQPSRSRPRGITPRSEVQTPFAVRRRDDETASQASRWSTDSQRGFILRIRRKAPDSFGNIVEQDEIVQDPRVIKKYLALRRKKEAESIDIQNIKATDDKDLAAKMLADELARLEKNRERRIARESQKNRTVHLPGSPDSSALGQSSKASGTQRKCANCGQVGHIKTNKKLCPMLNGTIQQDDGFGESGFSAARPSV